MKVAFILPVLEQSVRFHLIQRIATISSEVQPIYWFAATAPMKA